MLMLELKRYTCITCGAPLKEQDGKFVCANCKNEFHLEEKISEEEVVALNRATTDRNLLRFDDAFEEYDLLLKKYPKNEMANWGAFLSFYGIVYEQDLDGKYIPTCHRFSEKPVESSKYYYLFNDEHKRRAEEIEKLRVAIAEKAKRIPPYDVFICYKATEERFGRPYPTKESSWARDVYEMLTHELKLRVFFAEKSLGDSNEEYEPHIYSALNSAKLMFVMTTGIENVNAVWVKNEWKRYSKYIQEGQKKTIRVVYDNIEPYDLPLELQKTQAINHNEMDWGTKVKKAAQAIFVDPLEEELRKVREEMEALQKQANESNPAFEVEDGVLISYIGNGKEVSIPSGITSIGAQAFLDCTSLTSLIIPDGVTSIGGAAFKGCENLTSITVPNSVTEIGRYAFSGCGNLKHVEGPAVICKQVAKKCLQTITITGGEIDRYFLFEYCANLTSATILDGVTSIPNCMFYRCTKLKSVTIPDSVTHIGGGAFNGCTGLTSVTLPNGIKTINSSTFFACKSLTSVTLPDGLTAIKETAFCQCSSLKEIVIPESVTDIEKDAFQACNNLTIYAYAEKKPKGWYEKRGFLGIGIVESWNPHKRPGVWGYKGK